jgi:hypothetical protein
MIVKHGGVLRTFMRVQVTNCTNAKLVVSLVVPSWSDPLVPATANKHQVFTVS